MGATRTIKTEPSLSSTALDAIPAFMQHLKRNDDRIGIQEYPTLPSTTIATRTLTIMI